MKTSPDSSPSMRMQQNAAAAEALLKQLANAHRLMILCALVNAEKSAGELLDMLDLSQSAVSQHLASLREAGLVSVQKRGRQMYYQLASVEAQAILSTLYLIYCRN